MFYFGFDFVILTLKRIVKLLEMVALVSVTVTFILALTVGMCA